MSFRLFIIAMPLFFHCIYQYMDAEEGTSFYLNKRIRAAEPETQIRK